MKPGDQVKAVVIINRLWWLFGNISINSGSKQDTAITS